MIDSVLSQSILFSTEIFHRRGQVNEIEGPSFSPIQVVGTFFSRLFPSFSDSKDVFL